MLAPASLFRGVPSSSCNYPTRRRELEKIARAGDGALGKTPELRIRGSRASMGCSDMGSWENRWPRGWTTTSPARCGLQRQGLDTGMDGGLAGEMRAAVVDGGEMQVDVGKKWVEKEKDKIGLGSSRVGPRTQERVGSRRPAQSFAGRPGGNVSH